jgi:predicted transcriptional regulator
LGRIDLGGSLDLENQILNLMKVNKSKFELRKEYGLPGATAVLVIQMIEKNQVEEVDLPMIIELWKKIYRELSIKNTTPKNGCVFQSYAGLIFCGHVKIDEMISIKKGYSFGRNYEYVKTAIGILKSDYDNKWPQTLKATDLWNQVFDILKKRRIAHNSQLHILKALIENDLIEFSQTKT